VDFPVEHGDDEMGDSPRAGHIRNRQIIEQAKASVTRAEIDAAERAEAAREERKQKNRGKGAVAARDVVRRRA
jgi:hypothetical protein